MSSTLTIAQEYVFSPQDYKFMRFNVMNPDRKTPLLEQFHDLARFQSFLDLNKQFGEETNKIIRYICLCYDKQSPAMNQISDITKRKNWSGMAAGFSFDDDTGVFKKFYYNILNGGSEIVNTCIINLLSLENNPDWSLLQMTYESFYRKSIQMGLVSEEDPLKAEKLRGDLYKQLLDQSKIMKELAASYLNDINPFLREDMYRVINEDVRNRLNLTPERRAKWLKNQSTPTTDTKK